MRDFVHKVRAGWFAVVCFGIVAGCATAPGVHQFESTWALPHDFDEVWAATIEVFAENRWPIANLEKDSGIIVSDWVSVGREADYADCGQPGLAAVRGRQARFNVFVRQRGEGLTLSVNTDFQEQRSWDRRTWFQDCASTGLLEADVYSMILERTR